jgi:hypothetical protein
MSGGTTACLGGSADNMSYVNCDFTNANSGTSVGGTQATFVFCEAYNNTNYGFSHGSGASFIACKAYNNGLMQWNGSQASMYKCVAYGHSNASWPVVNANGQGCRIVASVIDGEGVARDGIDFQSSATTNIAIVDTVIQNTVDNAMETDFVTGMNFIEANCAFHNVGTGGVYSTFPWPEVTNIERVEADPLFTDDANGDYTLTEGSPLIGAGNTPGLFQDTTLYNSIGAYDGRTGTNAPGAYEYFPFGGTLRHLQPRMAHKELDLVHNEIDIVHNELDIRHNR